MKRLIKLLTTMLLTVFGAVAMNAQTLVKVSGIVTSADDGLPMIGVAVMDGSGKIVCTVPNHFEKNGVPGKGTVL